MKAKPKAAGTSAAKNGRPSKQDLLIRRVQAAGIDPALVDPRRILAGIAVDAQAPASARVAAAKALLAASTEAGSTVSADVEATPESDALSRRALQIIAERGRPN